LYGDHYAPHDIAVRELGTGKSRLEIAAGLGIKFKPLPAASVVDGISAARLLISRMWFDARKCAVGLDALRQYREKRDEKRGVNLGPLHDWSSHAADAFRTLANGHNDKAPARKTGEQPVISWMS
jgi:phage terminase large subunit